ncbi:MAG: efflux RND transporter periplasmic adaptor subunit [Candidatus Cryptobacteroides sp.]
MKKIFTYVSVAAVLAAAVSCGNGKGKQDVSQTENEEAPLVSVVTAGRQAVPQESIYSSSVEAYAKNNIAPQQSLRIRKINVEVGDFVKEGQILAEMDGLQLQQAELQMKNNETEYQRLKGLFEAGGLSQSDLDAMELSYKVSKTTYENLLDNTILRSPINGVISARNYDKDDLYSMGQPIYTVEQIAPVKLLVGISESEYSQVKKGNEVQISVDAFPGKTFKGTINRVYPTINQLTHTFNVEVIVPNRDYLLRPGMFARVTVRFGVNNSVVIPDTAVIKQTGSGERFVYVLNSDGTVTYQNVKLGIRMGNEFEILSGIEEGDKVVIDGQARLRDGIKVRLAE